MELANALKGHAVHRYIQGEYQHTGMQLLQQPQNDISFILDSMIVVLIEHQTTINPNMPLRFLSYVDEIYRQHIQTQHRKIYGRELIKLPAPDFYVFYDGEDASFDHQTLRLSDAFLAPSNQLDLTVNVYNLADGKSDKLKNSCPPLHDYSIFSNSWHYITCL